MKLLLQIILSIFLFCGSAPAEKTMLTVQRAADKEDYDVTFYYLDLNVSDSSTFISGSAILHIKPVIQALDQAVFDLSSLLVTDSVHVNGGSATFTHQSNEITVDFPDAMGPGDNVNVQIFYHGLGRNVFTEGIYNKFVPAWDKNVTWTLSEPFSALNFFPCKQSLTDKADSVYVFLSTDASLKAGSNGLLTASVPLENNRIRYEWKSLYPVAYYLISFTVSDYMDYSFFAKIPEYNDSVLVQNYIYDNPDYLEQNKEDIDKTGELLALYSRLFGLYPFSEEKYGHCVAPFSGGMEHQTMTTLINFSFLLVAHELTHQWFGDYVTCSTWQDIWLNEGFASYGEYLAYQYLVSQENADNWIESCNDFVMSQPGGSVFIPQGSAENENRIFDSRLSYKKGASVIHMLRQETGNDSVFFDMLKTFLSRYAGQNASGADLRDHAEEKTGMDFGQFFDQWYYGQGYPIHSISWGHRNDTLYINSLQTTSSETPFFNVLLEFRISGENIDTIVSFRQNAGFNRWEMFLPGHVTGIEADPHHWLLIDHSDISAIDNSGAETGFKVVPNPAHNTTVRIETSLNPAGRYTLFIANAAGEIVLTRESFSANEFVNVNEFPAGMYFVIIKRGRDTIHKKLIVN